jgi:hypothetical protein
MTLAFPSNISQYTFFLITTWRGIVWNRMILNWCSTFNLSTYIHVHVVTLLQWGIQGWIQVLKLVGATLFEAVGLGAALRPPLGPGWSPGGGPRGDALGSCWILEILFTLKHVSKEVLLLHFCHYKWGKI